MLALCYVLAAVYTISINVYGVLLLKFQKTASEAEDEDERVSDGKLLLAAVLGGAIASFAALATMAGLPAGVMGVYISINTLCDMGATCVNVIGDMAGCVVLQEKIKLEEN